VTVKEKGPAASTAVGLFRAMRGPEIFAYERFLPPPPPRSASPAKKSAIAENKKRKASKNKRTNAKQPACNQSQREHDEAGFHVSVGSKAALTTAKSEFRCTPNNRRHRQATSQGLLCARTGRWHETDQPHRSADVRPSGEHSLHHTAIL